ncbi:MAG: hypothetical protein MRZ79_19320, partial [Bacteroidia bacterium]|nr:hypothetical protein [Bacteroidia bacterium]
MKSLYTLLVFSVCLCLGWNIFAQNVNRSMLEDAIFLYENYYDDDSGKLNPAKGDKEAFVEVIRRNYTGTDEVS